MSSSSSLSTFSLVLVHILPPLQVYSTASSNLDLYKVLEKFIKIHKKLYTAHSALKPHNLYFFENLIPFSLFVPNLPDERNASIAHKISRQPDDDLPIKKPTLPSIYPRA